MRRKRKARAHSRARYTRYTAASYQAHFLQGGNASFNRLLRYTRMLRKEAV